MTVNSDAAVQADRALGPRYKWIALSNTTLGMLMATINQSIVLIALPDIFRWIGLNPLSPDNTSYLLWMFMGFLVVSAVLVVSFGRLGDMFGRVRMYTLGFAIFSVASIFLTVTWMHGAQGAMWLIVWRVVQGYLSRWLVEETIRFIKQSYQLEDLRVLHYERLRNLAALVMASAYFAAAWLGHSLKLALLASRVMKTARRFFGVPEFHYYALADGISFVLSRLRPCRPKLISPAALSQLWLFRLA